MDDDSISDLSSDLSSLGSLSPPPMDYPSPVSSQDYDSNVAASQPSQPRGCDGPPPAKKRRTVEPKPRTTEHLDLSQLPHCPAIDQEAQVDLLLKVLRKRRKIVVIAGAGISVSAGIPDFRSSNGLFTTLRSEHKLKASGKHLFDASVYQTDSSTSSFHDMVRSMSHLVSAAEPTEFHHMLATLASQGRLMRLYTQNVDGIDTSLPPLATSVPLSSRGPWPRTVQLHGGLEKMVCSKCSHLSDFEPALFDGPEPPPCNVCVETDKVRTDHAGKRSHGIGRLRPRIVLYNEHNPDEEAIGTVVSSDLRTRPDAVIVVGTSMKIPGVRRIVREMCGVVRGRRDGLAVWINRDPPPVGKDFEDCWDLIVRGPCDEVAKHAAMHRWNEDEYKECTESEVERVKQRNGDIKVVIDPPTDGRNTLGIPTPTASPRPKHLALAKPKIVLKLSAPKIKTKEANPTGKGASMSQVLKTCSSTTVQAKPTKKASKPSSTKPSDAKINQAFKVTKSSQPKSKKSKLKLQVHSEDELSMPMAPLSPQAARNNGPLQTPTKPPLFPNLTLSYKPELSSSPEDTDSWPERRRRETISPPGNIPQKIAMLLD
ncbi:Sirtuin family, catalytic core small domain [Lasallia pustulata]|uniref:Sirtuin family, catalytic core small domain n=1 Tax=Lasallia pustulata TaxID=136370 RepID=A0A1W5DCW0_9LECA|nr:Sirtuin family, catalytic core small domain [Lasallia pustulata]